MIEATGNIACHFNVLDLVATDWNFMGIEHKDVGSHEDRVAVQAHFHAVIWIFLTVFGICLYCSFISVGAVHQAFCGDAGQNPVQLHYFGNVALTVESGLFRIESTGEPCGGNSLSRLMNHFWFMTFDDAVIVGQKEE